MLLNKKDLEKKIVEQLATIYHTSPYYVLRQLSNFIYDYFLFDIKSDKNYWNDQSLSWNKKGPPIRPSRDDTENYKSLITKIGRPTNILIFGLTIELRDLIAEIHPLSNVYLIDFSEGMRTETVKNLASSNRTSEIWVKESWTHIGLKEKSFDAVLGDTILHQSRPEINNLLIRRVSELLKPQGHFIARVHTSKTYPDIKTIFDIDISQDDTVGNDDKVLALLWRLKSVSADRTKLVDYRKMAEILADRVSTRGESPITTDLFKKIHYERDYYPFKWRWAPPLEIEFYRAIHPYFQIIERRASGDYTDSALYPIFLCRNLVQG